MRHGEAERSLGIRVVLADAEEADGKKEKKKKENKQHTNSTSQKQARVQARVVFLP